jgi:TetR/AcrR family transcriptional regulator
MDDAANRAAEVGRTRKRTRISGGEKKIVVLRGNADETRERILDGAMVEFSEKGFDGARIDQIALRAGVNKNLLYHHYGNKDGLFTALLERTYERIRMRQNDFELRGQDPVDAVRKLVIFTGKIWVQYPEFLRLLGSENLNGGRHVMKSPHIAAMYQPLLASIRQILDAGIEQGTFKRRVDPIELYISISSLTAHYISNSYTFEALFGASLMTPTRVRQRLEHAADMVAAFLCSPSADVRPDVDGAARPRRDVRRTTR